MNCEFKKRVKISNSRKNKVRPLQRHVLTVYYRSSIHSRP